MSNELTLILPITIKLPLIVVTGEFNANVLFIPYTL